jgi:hypothetical protein
VKGILSVVLKESLYALYRLGLASARHNFRLCRLHRRTEGREELLMIFDDTTLSFYKLIKCKLHRTDRGVIMGVK